MRRTKASHGPPLRVAERNPAGGGYPLAPPTPPTPRPYLARGIGDVYLQGEDSGKVTITEEKNEFDIIQDALFKVVNDPTGTGQRAKVKGLEICGKTGTAQVEGAESHGWFAGYLPFNNPKVSFLIFLEHGGSGGKKPADMARVLCKYLKKKGYVN